jgi:Cys-tRNA synthase (O-phospho-L-seryl-tRNA:Cys-tRNA synthase)
MLCLFVSQASALSKLTDKQCTLLLDEFQHTFVREDDGYPVIDSCETRVVRLMWAQTIQRVYSTDDTQLDSYEALRSLPDAQFAKLVVNAACGSLMDSTKQDDAVIRIRVDSHGHFQRYVLNDTNRITALQTMLVASIVTLAVTWWRIEIN